MVSLSTRSPSLPVPDRVMEVLVFRTRGSVCHDLFGPVLIPYVLLFRICPNILPQSVKGHKSM